MKRRSFMAAIALIKLLAAQKLTMRRKHEITGRIDETGFTLSDLDIQVKEKRRYTQFK